MITTTSDYRIVLLREYLRNVPMTEREIRLMRAYVNDSISVSDEWIFQWLGKILDQETQGWPAEWVLQDLESSGYVGRP